MFILLEVNLVRKTKGSVHVYKIFRSVCSHKNIYVQNRTFTLHYGLAPIRTGLNRGMQY